MKKTTDGTPPGQNHQDVIDKLIEHEEVGEMGLLDLLFVEEILSQRPHA